MNDYSNRPRSSEWFVWTVRPSKFELVKDYIEKRIPEVTKVLYPTVFSTKTTKQGQVKKKALPLYGGYMFLQYTHDVKNPTTWVKINEHPFVVKYVGPCTEEDLATVSSLQKVEKIKDEKVDFFSPGDLVKVKGGVFSGRVGKVIAVYSNSVRVYLGRETNGVKAIFSTEDLDFIGHG